MGVRTRWMERLWSDAEAAYRAQILRVVSGSRASRLLDLGCDDGAWSDALRRGLGLPAERVSGLEVVPERAERARARGFDVRVGDLDERWPFADASFELAHANQVIEHVHRLDHFVRETARVLVSGGRTVVCTENLASWHNVAAVALGYQPFSLTNLSERGPIGNPFALHVGEPNPDESWQHVHVVTLTALTDLLTSHGFVIESTWGAGYHPFSGRFASRLAMLDRRHAHFIGVVARRDG